MLRNLFGRTNVIDVDETRSLVAAKSAVLVDVRELNEWEAGHIAGAIHVPLATLGSRLKELPSEQTLLAICRSGNRSNTATKLLQSAGYNAYNVSGGMLQWVQRGFPVETR